MAWQMARWWVAKADERRPGIAEIAGSGLPEARRASNCPASALQTRQGKKEGRPTCSSCCARPMAMTPAEQPMPARLYVITLVRILKWFTIMAAQGGEEGRGGEGEGGRGRAGRGSE